jgi:hypothetical protein
VRAATWPTDISRNCSVAAVRGDSTVTVDNGAVATFGILSFSAWRRPGSPSLCSRSARVPVVASIHASESSYRFQSSNVNVNPASVVTPCP